MVSVRPENQYFSLLVEIECVAKVVSLGRGSHRADCQSSQDGCIRFISFHSA